MTIDEIIRAANGSSKEPLFSAKFWREAVQTLLAERDALSDSIPELQALRGRVDAKLRALATSTPAKHVEWKVFPWHHDPNDSRN